MLLILLIVLVLCLVLGGVGYPQYGAVSLSPLAIIIVVLLILWAAGMLR